MRTSYIDVIREQCELDLLLDYIASLLFSKNWVKQTDSSNFIKVKIDPNNEALADIYDFNGNLILKIGDFNYINNKPLEFYAKNEKELWDLTNKIKMINDAEYVLEMEA